MRKACALLLAAALALGGCQPARPIAGGLPADTTPSPEKTMSETTIMPEITLLTPDAQVTTAPAATPVQTAAPDVATTPEATASPAPTQAALPQDFEEMVAQGLAARWQGSQAIVVCAKGSNSPQAELWLYERHNEKWSVAAGPWPAVVGKNGVGKQAEGEGKAPSGAFLLGTAFGWGAKPSDVKYQYVKLDSRDRWVDESASPFYNRWVRGTQSACGDGEDLKETEQYKHAIVIHYNDEALKKAGSAIFLHVWKAEGRGTLGCTAVSEDSMVRLLQWLDYARRPVLVQGTEEELRQLMEEDWGISCLPVGWGYADDFIPDAQLEIRYNTSDNFTGRRLPGYLASLAPMRMEAITALAAAAKELRAKGLGIRIYDAYRPQQATDAMVAWAEDEADTSTKQEYYPDFNKTDIPGKYVAHKSNHRLGGTVDLTLVDWKSGENLDMGGHFDFFGALSAFGYKKLSPGQKANRGVLRDAMLEHGFQSYDSEWWHFSYPVKGEGDLSILPREHVILVK